MDAYSQETITVTVADAEAVIPGEAKTVGLAEEGDYAVYKFAAAEPDFFRFTFSDLIDAELTVYDGPEMDGKIVLADGVAELRAGTYYVKLTALSAGVSGSLTVSVHTPEPGEAFVTAIEALEETDNAVAGAKDAYYKFTAEDKEDPGNAIAQDGYMGYYGYYRLTTTGFTGSASQVKIYDKNRTARPFLTANEAGEELELYTYFYHKPSAAAGFVKDYYIVFGAGEAPADFTFRLEPVDTIPYNYAKDYRLNLYTVRLSQTYAAPVPRYTENNSGTPGTATAAAYPRVADMAAGQYRVNLKSLGAGVPTLSNIYKYIPADGTYQNQTPLTNLCADLGNGQYLITITEPQAYIFAFKSSLAFDIVEFMIEIYNPVLMGAEDLTLGAAFDVTPENETDANEELVYSAARKFTSDGGFYDFTVNTALAAGEVFIMIYNANMQPLLGEDALYFEDGAASARQSLEAGLHYIAFFSYGIDTFSVTVSKYVSTVPGEGFETAIALADEDEITFQAETFYQFTPVTAGYHLITLAGTVAGDVEIKGYNPDRSPISSIAWDGGNMLLAADLNAEEVYFFTFSAAAESTVTVSIDYADFSAHQNPYFPDFDPEEGRIIVPVTEGIEIYVWGLGAAAGKVALYFTAPVSGDYTFGMSTVENAEGGLPIIQINNSAGGAVGGTVNETAPSRTVTLEQDADYCFNLNAQGRMYKVTLTLPAQA